MGLQNFIGTKALGYAGKRLDGYKTKIGGVTFILSGIIAILTAILGAVRLMFPDMTQLPEMTFDTIKETFIGGVASFGVGFGMLGLGGKSDKQKQAIIEQTQVIERQMAIMNVQNNSISAEQVACACDREKVFRKKDPSGMSPRD